MSLQNGNIQIAWRGNQHQIQLIVVCLLVQRGVEIIIFINYVLVKQAKYLNQDYTGKYIPRGIVEGIRSGVITALTGSGKTSAFEGKAFTLILVPRTIQATMNQRESTYELMGALQEGSVIITYEKFLGHMNVVEFNDMIQNGVYRIIVDEAHYLVAKKINKYRMIYALNAIFLSGTIDETFRPDLTHYKFIPEQRTPIYWTDGIVPDFENGLYFLDKAKALMRHYPNNCIVGAEQCRSPYAYRRKSFCYQCYS